MLWFHGSGRVLEIRLAVLIHKFSPSCIFTCPVTGRSVSASEEITAEEPAPLAVSTDLQIALSVNSLAVLALGLFPGALLSLCAAVLG